MVRLGCQNRDFTSSQKEIVKSGLVKSQSKSKDFTQGLLYNRYRIAKSALVKSQSKSRIPPKQK